MAPMKYPIYLFLLVTTSILFIAGCASTQDDSGAYTEYETLEVAPESTDSK